MATSNFGRPLDLSSLNLSNLTTTTTTKTFSRQNIPSANDWRELGYVTSVQNQGGSCGSCWAFSAAVVLEGQYKKVTGDLEKFSEQTLVNCVYKTSGCSGGYAHDAFNFIKKNKGLDSALGLGTSYTGTVCFLNEIKKINLAFLEPTVWKLTEKVHLTRP